ncbi:hypothetical protein Acr_06g0006180 [Actinidia rufa]|uniref:GAG-pre-integrase domain-containing protein n=1 Tax=Actinidia rufa TaxID=165716 RepID=A0A7J0EQC2_9ERIC|nr:hypothetical protein Acr_06g0006180 [Actinidia rufa]
MNNQQSELLKKLGVDFGDLRKEANITGRGESAKDPSGVEMRLSFRLKQGDLSITQYLHKAKVLSDELSAAGHPVSLQDFNLLLLSREFLHSDSFSSLEVAANSESSPKDNLVQRGRGCGLNTGSRSNDYRSNAPVAHLASYTPPTAPLATWIPDTGASHHATSNLTDLTHHDDYHEPDQLHVGNSILQTPSSSFHLFNALHVSSLTKSLLSISQFTKDNGVYFEFHLSHFFVKDQATQKILLRGENESGLYKLSKSTPVPPSAHLSKQVDSVCWHHRLGHPHQWVLHQAMVER